MQSEAEKITAGLTAAQRKLVLASEPGGWGLQHHACGADMIGPGAWMAAYALKRKGLGDVERDEAMYPPNLYFNNSLGLQVRALLENSK